MIMGMAKIQSTSDLFGASIDLRDDGKLLAGSL